MRVTCNVLITKYGIRQKHSIRSCRQFLHVLILRCFFIEFFWCSQIFSRILFHKLLAEDISSNVGRIRIKKACVLECQKFLWRNIASWYVPLEFDVSSVQFWTFKQLSFFVLWCTLSRVHEAEFEKNKRWVKSENAMKKHRKT